MLDQYIKIIVRVISVFSLPILVSLNVGHKNSWILRGSPVFSDLVPVQDVLARCTVRGTIAPEQLFLLKMSTEKYF